VRFRVAMVGACPYPVPQGSQVLLGDTARVVRDRGHEVHLVVYGHGVGSGDAQDMAGIELHRCARVPGLTRTAAGPSLLKPMADAALVHTLRGVVRAHGIEVIHAHNYEALLAALAARGAPVVYHAHNAMGDELPHFLPMGGPLGRLLDRVLPRRATGVIAPHGRLADYLISCGCASERVSVAPPACDATQFECGEVAEDVPPVLYAGNLDAYQNLDLLVRVMARVREQVPTARLRVATAAKGTIAGSERVETPDFESLRRVLAEDAVVVCPRVSWSGYPIKLLNAMAAGKAVVACRGSAHPITHLHDGIVVDDDDEEAFAGAVARLLMDADSRRALGANARDTVLRRHRPGDYAAAIERVYADVVRSSG